MSGARLFRHGRVDSTSERAFAALTKGAAQHGDAHVAAAQTAGRGRLGRRWESAEGEGLYLSLVLLPPAPAPNPGALTMGAGLAVLEGVRALGAGAARLKWPNDVLVEGAKIAGILVEARGLDPKRPHAVVGVGLNVRQRSFPAELTAERAVTSLAWLGLDVSCEAALDALLGRLRERMDEACRTPEKVALAYAEALDLFGERVRVEHGRGAVRGRLTALTLRGIELETERGTRAALALEHVLRLDPEE